MIFRRVLIVIAIWQTTMKKIAKAILFPFAAIVCGLAGLFGVDVNSQYLLIGIPYYPDFLLWERYNYLRRSEAI